ncbi:MAG TPA: T9SS type A sorting domain-containing protein, partial [Fibrella sp.]
ARLSSGVCNEAFSMVVALTVTPQVAAAGAVSGLATVCHGATGQHYSVEAVGGAATYEWSVPDGAVITAGQGTATITVDWGSATSGSVGVTPKNNCFSGAASSIAVTITPQVSMAGSITGKALVCPGAASEAYSIAPVTGATSYLWTVPVGASIIGGQGTTAITVNWGATGGTVAVAPVNSCFSGAGAGTVVTVNTRPAVTAITPGVNPQTIAAAFLINAIITDGDNNLVPSATIEWGDNSSSSVNSSASGGPVSAAHTYGSAGVYRVKVTATDACTSTTETFDYAVVYDPAAGFVAGGGWIMSPAGAYVANPALAGKANFGFVSKYQKGANVPTGNTDFKFHAGDLSFKSTVYEWLTVAGARAQFKGTGTINGTGDYGFLLTAIDGKLNGGGGVDKFRIKIWNKTTGDPVYDNQAGAGDDASPGTAIDGGSIMIQSNGNKNSRQGNGAEPMLTADALVLRNYPNPIDARTTIEFMLPQGGAYSLDIHDVNGSLVRHLQRGTAEAGHVNQVNWEVGQTPSGLYITRLITPQGSKAIKLLVE